MPNPRLPGAWKQKIREDNLYLSDNTTGDVSTSQHGFAPKAPNDTGKYLRGDGTWAALSGGILGAFSGARVYNSADATGVDTRTEYVFTFDSERFDIGGWHSTSSNTGRFTVPSGITVVVVTGGCRVKLATADQHHSIYIKKYNSSGVLQEHVAMQDAVESGAADRGLNCCSGPVDVVAGDYFQLSTQSDSGGDSSVTIDAANTFFAIVAVGSS